MTADPQEVLPGQQPSGPSGSAERVVTALLDSDDDDALIRELGLKVGIGNVEVLAADSAESDWRAIGQPPNHIITKWKVMLNGTQIGYITRHPGRLTFRAYSTVNTKSLQGTQSARMREALYHVLAAAQIPATIALRMSKTAKVEESLSEGEEGKPSIISADGKPAIEFHDLPDLPSISPAQWARISQMMSQKGYDSRGGPDAKRAILGMIGRREGNVLHSVHNDWVSVIAQVLQLKMPVEPSAGSTEGGTSSPSRVFRRAVREWGLTDDSSLGGYILPNGRMLDLSGGSGKRAFDHREAIQFLDDAQRNEYQQDRQEGMFFFQRLGAIRWMPEGPGLHIKKKPTPRQLSTIQRIISERAGKSIYMDVGDPKWGNVGQEYPASVARRIPQDIMRFYRTGTLTPVSDVMKFHSDEAAHRWVGRILQDARDDDDEPYAPPIYRPLPLKARRAHAKRMAENPEDKEFSDILDTSWAKGSPPYANLGSVAVMTRRWLEFGQYNHGKYDNSPMKWGGTYEMLRFELPSISDKATQSSFHASVELMHDNRDYTIWAIIRVGGHIGDKYGWDHWNGMNDAGFVLTYTKDHLRLAEPVPAQIPEPTKTKLAAKVQAFLTKLKPLVVLAKVTWPKSLQPYTAESVVSALLGENEQMDLPFDDYDPDFDPDSIDIEGLAMDAGVIQKYRQIDGDFGDPWAYGGTWYSAYVERHPDKWDSVIHIAGLEGEGKEDFETWSEEVKAAFAEPEQQEEFKRRLAALGEIDPNGHEDEDIEDEMKQAIADRMNTEFQMTVYRTNAEEPEGIRASDLKMLGLTHEQWLDMTPANRVSTWADLHGWYEHDSQPITMTKEELSTKLGVKL